MGMTVSSRCLWHLQQGITSSLAEGGTWGSFPSADAGWRGMEDVRLPPEAAPRDNDPQRTCTGGFHHQPPHR